MRPIPAVIVTTLSFLLFVVSCNKSEELEGCTSYTAINYNSNATVDDGSCIYDTIEDSTIYYPPPPPGPTDFDVSLSTTWNDNWNDWDININGVTGTISTTWNDDWNDWDFSFGGVQGDISTTWNNDWNDWDITGTGFSIDLSTTWNNDWNDWDIDDNNSNWDADVSSTWNDNWNDWDVNGVNTADSVNIDFSTTWNNDWDDWDASGTFGSTHPVPYKMASVFIPVIVSALKQQGIIP